MWKWLVVRWDESTKKKLIHPDDIEYLPDGCQSGCIARTKDLNGEWPEIEIPRYGNGIFEKFRVNTSDYDFLPCGPLYAYDEQVYLRYTADPPEEYEHILTIQWNCQKEYYEYTYFEIDEPIPEQEIIPIPGSCSCLTIQDKSKENFNPYDQIGLWEFSKRFVVPLHLDEQDEECDAWYKLINALELARDRGDKEFFLHRMIDSDDWESIITLPRMIGTLKQLRTLTLYGSNIKWLPVEIGGLEKLTTFDPYTSHQLHWFPYEITKCKELKSSTISTRALYGNHKTIMPFPELPCYHESFIPKTCSICDTLLEANRIKQKWVMGRIGTDHIPMLVNGCSQECLDTVETDPPVRIRPEPMQPIPKTIPYNKCEEKRPWWKRLLKK